jgi:hypothetical protein
MRNVRYSCLRLVLAMLFGYAIASQDGRGLAMDVDKFHWGELACEGLAAGIAIEKNAPNEPIMYHIALANRSASPRRITLFSMEPGLFRLRVIGRQGAVEEGAPALYSDRHTSNPQVKITETLAPGQVFERRGDPTTFRDRLSGSGTLQLVFSIMAHPDVRPVPEESDRWCHVKSAEVEVEFYPSGRKGQPTPSE